MGRMLGRWAPLAIVILVLTSSTCWVQVSNAAAQELEAPETVRDIEIRGNKRIETPTIRSRIKTRIGRPVSEEMIRDDIKSVYQLGFFLDVHVESEPAEGGVKIIYIVAERPFVAETKFVGNVAILTDKLKERITIKPNAFLDDVEVKENAEQLRRYYDEEGYYNTEVIPVLNMDEDRVTLIFFIKEGAKAKIKRVEFDGADSFKEKTLQENIGTRRYSPLTSWLTSSGYYKKGALTEDIERLKDYYMNNGYLQVQVGTPSVEFKDDRTQTRVTYPILHGEIDYLYNFYAVRLVVTFPLIEGDQYHLRAVTFEGNQTFSSDELGEAIQMAEGDLFRRDRLRKGVAEIHDRYGEKGYLYANVIPQYSIDEATQTVDLVLQVDEDRPMRVRGISISGNDKTRDKVIRREIRVNEQERVNTRLLRRSFQRINNLNFFDSIDIAPERFDEDFVDLRVRVKEKSTGSLSMGGGYSSINRFVALGQISQGNLFGRGQLLRVKLELGKRRTTYSLTFREPYLLDHPVSGTVSVFNQERNFSSYKEKRIGGNLILGKSFTEYISGSMSYTLESLRLFDVDSSAPQLIKDQPAETLTSSIGSTIARDTRDFIFDPKEGSRTALSFEYAGTFLGGSNNFVKTILDVSRFFPMPFETVFSLHGRLGYAHGNSGTDLPIGERFFVGGINTVRGFSFGRAGPIDDQTNQIIGGNKELIFNAEYLIPLVPEARVKGVLFFDAGKAFDDDESIRLGELRYGAGFGMRWISPIGPLRLEWGYNLQPEGNERKSNVEFTIGTLF